MLSFDTLLQKAQEVISDLDTKRFQKAYAFAEKHLKEKYRLSGEPRISHPLAVTNILLDIRPDEDVLMAGLLHSTLDEEETLAPQIEHQFGEEVLLLIRELRILQKSKHEKDHTLLLQSILKAIKKDFRILLLRLADRLHSMQTLEFLPKTDRQHIAEETMYVYAPIASRLGIYAFKAPLEDLAFYYLFPQEYQKIRTQALQHEMYRDQIIKESKKTFQKILQEHNIPAEILGRTKHYYSLYKKIEQKKVETVEEVYDIFAMRIIVPDLPMCYMALGVLHEHFSPMPQRFKDYIAISKSNGYQSLHTTLMGVVHLSEKSFPIEVQIRTQKMNDEAEYGVAAHWHYKEKKDNTVRAQKTKSGWAKEFSEIEERLKDHHHVHYQQFSKRFFAEEEITVCSEDGRTSSLTEGATLIDFAFALGTHEGRHLFSAKVNGKPQPLSYVLKDRDVVDITLHDEVTPQYEWLEMCNTLHAQKKIKETLEKKDIRSLMSEGKKILNEYLLRLGYPHLDRHRTLLENYNGKKLNFKQREEVLLHIGTGSLSPLQVIEEMEDVEEGHLFEKDQKRRSQKKDPNAVIVSGQKGIPIKMASCCKPKRGDKIIGFTTRGNHITIHTKGCKTLSRLEKKRLLEAHFEGEKVMKLVQIEVLRSRTDRVGLIHEISGLFSKYGINIDDIDYIGNKKIIFTVESDDLKKLANVIGQIEKIEGVNGARRVRKGVDGEEGGGI